MEYKDMNAIGIVRLMLTDGVITAEQAAKYFPELTESYDERIRKWCISHFKECINVIKDNDEYKEYLNNKVIPWLEKYSQVKEFPISQHKNKTCKENDGSLTSEDERISEELISNFKETIENIRSEEIIPHSAKVLVGKMQKWIAWLEKKGEQKSAAWCKEDELMLNNVIDTLKPLGETTHSGYAINSMIDFLKSLKDRVQPKHEWRDEDDKKAERIIRLLQEAYDINCINGSIDWLKFLKDRYTWKPSKKQITVCKEVYADLLSAKGFDLGTVNSELNRLEEELKKLKG